MATMRKRNSETFKAEVVLGLLKEKKAVTEIASERHVHPNQLYEWRAITLKGLPSLFSPDYQG
jgi:transposase-like protein